MKVNKILAAALSSLVFCSSAYADVIYENGSFNGTFAGAQISPPQGVSDSFTVGNPSTITKTTIGLFVPAGEQPVSLTWSIGSQPFGMDFGTATALLSNQLVYSNVNGTSDVYLSTFDLNVALGPGDYWLTLSDATADVPGAPVGWDINFGPSQAFYMNGAEQDSTDSEYFRLEGTVGNGGTPVPEPASLAIFVGGLMGVAASRRRRAGKKS